MSTTDSKSATAAAGPVLSEGLGLVERLRQSADEVESFPHPSHCDHLHSAFKVMREAADELQRRFADEPSDTIIELAGALEVRRILEEIKKVAAIYPAADMPTLFQSAWQTCCEEIFYRATGEQWGMNEDADRFARRRAANEPLA